MSAAEIVHRFDRTSHHLCEDEACQDCFIAFASDMELAQHRREVHSRTMPRWQREVHHSCICRVRLAWAPGLCGMLTFCRGFCLTIKFGRMRSCCSLLLMPCCRASLKAPHGVDALQATRRLDIDFASRRTGTQSLPRAPRPHEEQAQPQESRARQQQPPRAQQSGVMAVFVSVPASGSIRFTPWVLSQFCLLDQCMHVHTSFTMR